MRIAVHSNAGTKFLEDLIEHWKSRGHTVEFEPGANPALDAEADLVFIDFLDNNFYRLFNGEMGSDAPNWKSEPKKKLFVRAVDIDVWMGRHRDPRIWEYLDGMFVINDFFKKKIIEESNNIPLAQEKVHMVRMGVNLDKFTLKKESDNNHRIAMVADTMWYAKAPFEAVRLLEMLRSRTGVDYTLHIRGQWDPPEWHNVAWNHLLKSLDIEDKVILYNRQDDMNEWYEDKDYILCTSYKEAFSFALAEGMAKGLKPVSADFFAARETWPEWAIYTNWQNALGMLLENTHPEKYRKFIEENYSSEKMVREYDAILGT